jgi:hypothetical protein
LGAEGGGKREYRRDNEAGHDLIVAGDAREMWVRRVAAK